MNQITGQSEFLLLSPTEIVQQSVDERLESIREVMKADKQPMLTPDTVKEEGERSVSELKSAEQTSEKEIGIKIAAAANSNSSEFGGSSARMLAAKRSVLGRMDERANRYWTRANNEYAILTEMLDVLNDEGDTYNPDLMTPSLLLTDRESPYETTQILSRAALAFDEHFDRAKGRTAGATFAEFIDSVNINVSHFTDETRDTLTAMTLLAHRNAEKRSDFWKSRHEMINSKRAAHVGGTATRDAVYRDAGKHLTEEQAGKRYVIDFVE